MASFTRKQRGTGLVVKSLVTLNFIFPWVTANLVDSAQFCSRSPPGVETDKTPGDNGFRIKIAGRPQPERYTPGQVYTVSISGTYPRQTFTSFYLVSVPQNAEDESTAIGAFQHLNSSLTKFSDDCFFIVTNVDQQPKSEVEILWTAPGTGTGCLEFRATVIETQVIWYKDDGALSRTFCEDTDASDGLQPVEMMPDCCACGTAKYQMTFHGLWSPQTHPKHFPTDHQLLQWSNIVGASHSKHFTIWRYGALASTAVQDICELGRPQMLEQQMRKHSQDIRTVIKTPNIQWSDPHGLEQLRWAHFSVDRKNHLLSMLTRASPSPDWCVGVSALNLCLANCSWSGDLAIDLYPWDSGTDDGLSYMSPNKKGNPPVKIHRLTNTFPADDASPFYGPEILRPMAVLKLRRIQPKPEENIICSQDLGSPSNGEDEPTSSLSSASHVLNRGFDLDPPSLTDESCTSQWTSWSDCSVSCGLGVRTRSRRQQHPHLPLSADVVPVPCSEKSAVLSETEECYGRSQCEDQSDDCAMSPWSKWSLCSTICDTDTRPSTRFRLRSYMDESEKWQCEMATREEESCFSTSSPVINCSQQHSNAHSPLFRSNQLPPHGVGCDLPVDEGPCHGRFPRWHYDVSTLSCQPFNYGGCQGNANRFQTEQECLVACDLHPDEEEKLLKPLSVKDATNPTDVKSKPTPPVSHIPFQTTEAYDAANFQRFQETSSSLTSVSSYSVSLYLTTSKPVLLISSASSTSKATASNHHRRRRGCIVSKWSEWSHCSATCGASAYRLRTRSISKAAPDTRTASRRCPSRKQEKLSCGLPKCPSDCRLSEWTEWSPCAKTCGSDSIQERARHVLQQALPYGIDPSCGMQLIRRLCVLPPCLKTALPKTFLSPALERPRSSDER